MEIGRDEILTIIRAVRYLERFPDDQEAVEIRRELMKIMREGNQELDLRGKGVVYFMDQFKSTDIELERPPENNVEGLEALIRLSSAVKRILREKYGVNPVQIEPFKFYRHNDDVLFEYIVKFEDGFLSAKLMFTDDPERLLFDYYKWEEGD